MTTESDHTGYSTASLDKSGKALDQAADTHKKSEFKFIKDAEPTDTCFGLVAEGSDDLKHNYGLVYKSIADWLGKHGTTLKAAADARVIDSKIYRVLD